ncbi:hypothetical protein EB796_000571 [Bugula neritina]|uniref:Uncharacterized protein n=1 Tax=Bugula neritina TaxID=10212 RepID=A0A7J7KSH6_BUGNE|nr:hypothetical protein EB796_000571 [Bugula neritina]
MYTLAEIFLAVLLLVAMKCKLLVTRVTRTLEYAANSTGSDTHQRLLMYMLSLSLLRPTLQLNLTLSQSEVRRVVCF